MPSSPGAGTEGHEAGAVRGFTEAAEHLYTLARAAESGALAREELDGAMGEAAAALARAFGPRPRARPGDGAKWQMLAYLRAHVGEWVSGEELKAIAGIGEWARRVRELRVQDGWAIEEARGSYRLSAGVRDEEEAARWRLYNTIRRQPGPAIERIMALLEATAGTTVSRDDIDYVARVKEGSRRLRQLRDERGWPIDSHIDDPSLRPGEYRLISSDPADRRDPRQRLYPEGLREKVFSRDQYTCQECGRDRAAAERSGDTRFYLEVHHKLAVAGDLEGLAADVLHDPNNLTTLCHRDHVGHTGSFQRLQTERRRTA
jgi:5-methylcytosine-specific restriction endonuclease McrA